MAKKATQSQLESILRNRFGDEIRTIEHHPATNEAIVLFRDGRRRIYDTTGEPAQSRAQLQPIAENTSTDPTEGLLPHAVCALLEHAVENDTTANELRLEADRLRQSAIRALRKQGMTTPAAITAIQLWDKHHTPPHQHAPTRSPPPAP